MWDNRAKIGQAPSRRQASPASHFCRTWLRALGASAENSPQSPEGSANSVWLAISLLSFPFVLSSLVVTKERKRERKESPRPSAPAPNSLSGSPGAPSHRVPEARPCPPPYAEQGGHRRAESTPSPPQSLGLGRLRCASKGAPGVPAIWCCGRWLAHPLGARMERRQSSCSHRAPTPLLTRSAP